MAPQMSASVRAGAVHDAREPPAMGVKVLKDANKLLDCKQVDYTPGVEEGKHASVHDPNLKQWFKALIGGKKVHVINKTMDYLNDEWLHSWPHHRCSFRDWLWYTGRWPHALYVHVKYTPQASYSVGVQLPLPGGQGMGFNYAKDNGTAGALPDALIFVPAGTLGGERERYPAVNLRVPEGYTMSITIWRAVWKWSDKARDWMYEADRGAGLDCRDAVVKAGDVVKVEGLPTIRE